MHLNNAGRSQQRVPIAFGDGREDDTAVITALVVLVWCRGGVCNPALLDYTCVANLNQAQRFKGLTLPNQEPSLVL